MVPDRWEAALVAVVALFAEQGYRATPVDDLARVAGCSKAALYREFGSKDALLAAAAEPFVEEVEVLLATPAGKAGAAEDRIAVATAWLRALGSHRASARVLLEDQDGRRSPIGQLAVDQQRRLAARLAGRRASLLRQVRARCALSIALLVVGELGNVPLERLHGPVLDAMLETLTTSGERGRRLSGQQARSSVG